jgi:hypothetical protein
MCNNYIKIILRFFKFCAENSLTKLKIQRKKDLRTVNIFTQQMNFNQPGSEGQRPASEKFGRNPNAEGKNHEDRNYALECKRKHVQGSLPEKLEKGRVGRLDRLSERFWQERWDFERLWNNYGMV